MGARQRSFQNYEGKDEQSIIHQEIETPLELVDELLSYVPEENFKDVLDPCVGPGNMIKSIVENKKYSSLTVYDLQKRWTETDLVKHQGIKSYHQSWLEASNILSDWDTIKYYDLILMNPPWAKIGTQFIQKGIQSLKPGGILIGIMDYNKMTKYTQKSPSVFNKMMKQGYFLFISTDGSRGKGGYFHGVADSIQFVFKKGTPPKDHKTVIKNRNQEYFEYVLKGNEQYVPQIPNENDYFDWDNGIKVIASPSTSTFKEEMYVVLIRKTKEKSIVKKLPVGENVGFGGCAVKASETDFDKVKDFFLGNCSLFYDHYVVSHGWPRFPPVRKDLLQ